MIKLKNDNAEGELFNDNARQPLIRKKSTAILILT